MISIWLPFTKHFLPRLPKGDMEMIDNTRIKKRLYFDTERKCLGAIDGSYAFYGEYLASDDFYIHPDYDPRGKKPHEIIAENSSNLD